jgi:hypothetical protein
MLSVGGVLLGLVNIAIVVVLLLIIGAVAIWLASWLSVSIPQNVQKLYLVLVALIALYMIIALIFGLPSVSIVRW